MWPEIQRRWGWLCKRVDIKKGTQESRKTDTQTEYFKDILSDFRHNCFTIIVIVSVVKL